MYKRQQQGLLRIDATEPLRVSFYPLQQGAPAPPREACPTRYMQFNSDAQALFKGRMLTPAECAVMHGWMDNLGFTPAGVLMLLSYAIGRKDIRVSVKYIDAIATRCV